MPTTPTYALPYPIATDTADVPRDIQALATKVDTTFTQIRPPLVASLPAGPADGQECYWLVDNAGGAVWHMRYRTVAARWEFVGGPPMLAATPALVGLAAAGPYQDFSDGQGPLINLPATGDYLLTFGASIYSTAASQAVYIAPNATNLASAQANAVIINQSPAAAGIEASVGRQLRANAIGGQLKLQYQTSVAGGFAERRWVSALAIRI